MNFIYADSIIALGRLSPEMREGLLESKKGIGQLILENRIESFRAILDCGTERAGGLGEYFQIGEDTLLLYRTYNMIIQGRPVMVITEKFPESYFREWDPTSTRGTRPMRSPATKSAGSSGDGEKETERIVAVLEQFVRTVLLREQASVTLTRSTALMGGEGILTPDQFFPLLAFIGERFAVRFEDEELIAENFRSLSVIAERIIGRRPRRRP